MIAEQFPKSVKLYCPDSQLQNSLADVFNTFWEFESFTILGVILCLHSILYDLTMMPVKVRKPPSTHNIYKDDLCFMENYQAPLWPNNENREI